MPRNPVGIDILKLMVRCIECGCSRFDVQGFCCALCRKPHGIRSEPCHITAETQRVLVAHAAELQRFGVALTEAEQIRKDAGTLMSAVGLVVSLSEAVFPGSLRKAVFFLYHELTIPRNEILRLRLSEPEEIDQILVDMQCAEQDWLEKEYRGKLNAECFILMPYSHLRKRSNAERTAATSERVVAERRLMYHRGSCPICRSNGQPTWEVDASPITR